MKKRLLAIAALMLALTFATTVVFASNKTVPMQKKIPDVPYEEVSVADQIGFWMTFFSGRSAGAAFIHFNFIGLGEQMGERTLSVSVDNYNVINLDDIVCWPSAKDLSHEITCGWDDTVDLYGDVVEEERIPHCDGTTSTQYLYLWNYDHATMRVIIREGSDILGYALINLSDLLCRGGIEYQDIFQTCDVVKAVMFMKDGEPYREVTMDEVNALLDEAAISANKAENAEDKAVKEKETEDDAILPEDNAENKGDNSAAPDNASKIIEEDSEDENTDEAKADAEPEAEDGSGAGKAEENGEDEDIPTDSSRRED